MALVSPTRLPAQSPPDSGGQLTWRQFRGLVAQHAEAARPASKSREKQPAPDLRAAGELFGRLLESQARAAAAQQSLDRLSGWSKAIQLRYQTQNASELDVDVIRFAEAKMAARSAYIEAEQQRLAAQANALIGRPATAPLTAILPDPLPNKWANKLADKVSNQDPKDAGTKSPQGSKDPKGSEDAMDLLTQGEDLLGKAYKNYQYGGIPLTALLWQEQQMYHAELDYRLAQARGAAPGSWEQPAD